MSVTTSLRLDLDRLTSEVGTRIQCAGVPPEDVGQKALTADVPDDVLQAAVDAHVFVDLTGNRDNLRAKGLAYLALPAPTAVQTTKAVRALVMLALGKFDDTTGT